MSRIVWLASYPKSGNTWVRVLLANYLQANAEPFDINALADSSWIASARRVFDEWCGVEASALDQAVVDRLRPDVYRRMAAASAENLYLKVHDAWTQNDHGEAIFPADVTRALVYIVRNPLDVAISSSHHWRLSRQQAVERMCDSGYCVGSSESKLAEQLRQFIGSWSGHVRSWLDESGLNGHVVRYEDLRLDPERVLTGILEACALSSDPTRVRRAVRFSDFGELQRQERAHGFRERPLQSRGAFFRRGEVGAWRDELPAPAVGQLVQAHREMMTRFSYLEEVD